MTSEQLRALAQRLRHSAEGMDAHSEQPKLRKEAGEPLDSARVLSFLKFFAR